MQSTTECGKLSVKNGWLVCPQCGRQIHGIRIGPETEGKNLAVRCRTCRTEIILDIESGQRVNRQRP